MPQWNEYYVDPSIDANSGAGTIGDPYGDLQYALNQITRDSADGDRINIKAGTAEVTTAVLDFTSYGTPDATAPIIFQGYTSAADDGGIGEIDGNGGNYPIIDDSTIDGVHLIDLKIGNCGNERVIYVDRYCLISHCEIYGGDQTLVEAGTGSTITYCRVHNGGGTGIEGFGLIAHNYVYNSGSRTLTIGIENDNRASFNIVSVSGSATGIKNEDSTSIGKTFTYNSIYSNGGTGTGLYLQNRSAYAVGNVVSGFSGTGGIGIDEAQEFNMVQYNYVYNCATAFSDTDDRIKGVGNETLTDAPFVDAANGDFRPTTVIRNKVFDGLSYRGLATTPLHRTPGAVQVQQFDRRIRAQIIGA